MRMEVNPRLALRWLPYLAGLLSFHLFLLLTVPHVVGAVSPRSTIEGELVVAALLLYGAQNAVRRYVNNAWLQGYATGHWDGLEDARGDDEP